MRRETKVYASEAVLIDPADCGSTLAYTITGPKYFNATVDLSDCNRKIQWYFGNKPSAVDKIDKAIAVLTRFREAFVKHRPKRRRKRS